MKMRKILTTLLAYTLAFTFTIPTFAVEGEAELPATPPVQEETTDPSQPPEELPPAEESPAEEENPSQEPPAEFPAPGEPSTPLPEEPEPPTEPELPVLPADPIPEAPEVPDAPAEDVLPPEEQEPSAEEDPPAEPEPEPSQDPEAPIINVIVPDSGQVVINPYRMPVDLGQGQVRDQIINPMQTLTNLSTVPVQIDAWVAGRISPESRAQFVPLAPLPDAVEKEIFMYAEFQADSDMWTCWYGDMENQILVSPSAQANRMY